MAFTSTSFIPTVYSSNMVAALYANTCLSQIANTDYEGEIKEHGDTVKIRLTPHINIYDYTPGVDLESDSPAKNSIDLLINKGKYFNFPAEYVEVKQSDIPLVAQFAKGAGLDMKIEIEKGVFADIYTDAPAENSGANAGKLSGCFNLGTSDSPLLITKTNIIESISNLSTVLDEQDVPVTDRWCLLPSWAHGLLQQCDEFSAEKSGDDKSALRLGKIGNFSNFDIYKSNTLNRTNIMSEDSSSASGSSSFTPELIGQKVDIIAGHKSALTFATQLLVDGEKVKNPKRFEDYHRGLQVYGYKVAQPKALVHSVWRKNVA